jgi:beta-galactosidase
VIGWSGIAYGGDYNPEQWDEDVWAQDAALMREAGVDLATVGVFSWARIEPRPGEYDLDWLDRVLDLLHGAGVRVDLATATASAPPWLTRLHPEVLPVDERGTRATIGSRQTWCPSSPVYRERSLALVEVLAKRYAGHPALAMWHVSNELGCHNARCYCSVSAAHFRRWLSARYHRDLEQLNTAWGTTFWSQRYGDWEEIQAPAASTAQTNPTQLLDWARFSSDALLEQYLAEREVLRRLTPGVPVTTNFMVMGQVAAMDYLAWGPHQDVVSNDHYLDGRLEDPRAELAFSADLTRGVARGESWLLMEHSPSAVNWQPVNYAKPPGDMLRTSLSHVARGADGVAFFQWRASAAGAEKFHSGMVPHAGTDSRRWREVVELGAVLDRLDELAGSHVQAEVALLHDWPARWACDSHSMPSRLVRYLDMSRAVHSGLRALGVTADVVGVDADLSRYRLVVVPTLYLCDDATTARVEAAARGGATVLVTYFSGIADQHDHVRLGGYPGAFRDLLGIRTEEFHPLGRGQQVHLDDGSTATTWTEHAVAAPGTEVLASLVDGPLAGTPALTRRPVGRGSAWYLATSLDRGSMRRWLERITAEAGCRPAAEVPEGAAGEVDVVRRRRGQESWLFVLNHGAEALRLPGTRGRDLVADADVDGDLVVPRGGCAVLREAT